MWGLQPASRSVYDSVAFELMAGEPVAVPAQDVLHSRPGGRRLAQMQRCVAGDHQAWRSATAQLARFELMMKSRRFRDDDYAIAIRDLRLAGDDDGVGLAVKKLGDDGPCHAVAIAGHPPRFLEFHQDIVGERHPVSHNWCRSSI